MRRRLREWLANGVLAVVAVVGTLLLAEGALRVAGVGAAGRGSPWFAGGSHPRHLFLPAAGTGYLLAPGFAGRDVAASGEFDVAVRIDAEGRRQHPPAAPRGRPPVLVLGDSMTYGEGVAVEDAYPALLETALGRPVVNAGVPGYNSRQMVARGRELLAAVDAPTVLVVLAAEWDVDRCLRPFVVRDGYLVAWGWRDRVETIDGNLYSWEVRSPRFGPATARFKGRSYLARLALPALARLVRGAGERRRPALPPAEDWTPCADALDAFAGEAGAAGRDLRVVLADSPDERARAATARVAATLAERGVATLLLDDVLPRERVEERRFPRDRHWNADGHRAVAAALAVALVGDEPAPR